MVEWGYRVGSVGVGGVMLVEICMCVYIYILSRDGKRAKGALCRECFFNGKTAKTQTNTNLNGI